MFAIGLKFRLNLNKNFHTSSHFLRKGSVSGHATINRDRGCCVINFNVSALYRPACFSHHTRSGGAIDEMPIRHCVSGREFPSRGVWRQNQFGVQNMTQNQAHILVADQDRMFARLLKEDLKGAGFKVSCVADGQSAMELIEDHSPDLLMTERQLTGVSGIELCRRLKGHTATKQMPILMLATNSDHVDLARALDTGADVFVHKPVSALELVARARALLRRAKPTTVGERLEYEDIVVEMETLRAFRGGQLLKLGPTEFNILATFVDKPGRVWTRDQLLDTVWGPNTYIDPRTVDVHVGRLRKTLRTHGDGDPFRTIRGAGYALG